MNKSVLVNTAERQDTFVPAEPLPTPAVKIIISNVFLLKEGLVSSRPVLLW